MADDKDIADGEDGGGGKKKLIIIIAAAVLLLLIGGGAAFFLLGGDEEETAEDGPAEEEVAVEEADPVYHKLDPAFVVNLPEGGPAKMLQVAIQVMTRHPTVVDTLSKNDPLIRHHLINLLENQQAAELLTLEGKQGLRQQVQDLLVEQLETLKERGEIGGVYFTHFVLQ